MFLFTCGNLNVAVWLRLHPFTRGAQSVALGVRVMSNPIISTHGSEYDSEGGVQSHRITALTYDKSFAGTALSSGPPAEGLRTATPCVVTSESDAR